MDVFSQFLIGCKLAFSERDEVMIDGKAKS
jgi:hypothetical protein